MSAFYDEMREMATELLSEFKQGRVTLHRDVDGDPRPPDWPTWQPWPDNSRREVYELDAVVKGVSAKLIDGDVVKATDLEVVCSNRMALVEINGAPVTPVQSSFDVGLIETLSIDGKPLTIIQAIPIPAAGTKVVHRFVVRA